LIEVVNVKTCKDIGKHGDVYIGRGNARFKESIFANPFPIGRCVVNDEPEVFTRDGCITRFEKYIINGETVNVNGKTYRGHFARDALKDLTHAKRLICYCFPLNCHGDVLKRLVSGIYNDTTLDCFGVK
jgi:hypothetical protein